MGLRESSTQLADGEAADDDFSDPLDDDAPIAASMDAF